MKYETFSCPISDPFHQTQSSSNCQIRIFTWCLKRSTPAHKNGPIPLWLAPHMMTLKSPFNLYALPSPIKMTAMIRQHTKLRPPQPDHQTIHCPMANFGPLVRGSVTNPMLITAFDAYLTPTSPGAMSLVHKYINLKEPYNQDIKEKVTTKKFLEKKASFT